MGRTSANLLKAIGKILCRASRADRIASVVDRTPEPAAELAITNDYLTIYLRKGARKWLIIQHVRTEAPGKLNKGI
jgi:hypothetical protein